MLPGCGVPLSFLPFLGLSFMPGSDPRTAALLRGLGACSCRTFCVAVRCMLTKIRQHVQRNNAGWTQGLMWLGSLANASFRPLEPY